MGWSLFFLAVIATITGFIIGMLLAYLFDESSSKSMSIKDITVFVITTMLIMYTAANAAVYNMTPSSKDRIATFAEAASLYGFSSGSEYPLEIGGRSVSANGEAAIGGGFAISAYIRMQAGASILVDYQYPDGSHEALEIPLSKIKFNIIGDDETSSMVINLIDLPYAKGYVSKDKHPGHLDNR